MKMFYLLAAIVGAVVPYIFYFQHVGVSGLDFGSFFAAITATPAVRGFTADLLISSFVFWAFMFHRRRLGHGPGPALYIVLTLLIGLACALPAYLYAMEARRGAAAASS
jgi:hypothetical protein